ncbi:MULTISPECIES: hypothetical protein [Paenibacillus]|uniref:hypothetical protein n=1 Tax=Paenibacillus TaxID=44249 RepID=UPI001C65112B|nr:MULTISPECIES: hypothetical protein [Paenibacillus]MEE4577836.1 hypothetical protein [Paenibacillus polymyxa]QYK61808.1 hypothetical protein KAI37_02132 [Paenibacillus sp. S25]WHX37383.1 hypothetical protein QNH38_08050 [Paenibacillus polymyxa]
MELNEEQLENVKHALGLNYNKKPTRNNFYCDADDAGWNDLVAKGLATKRGGWDEESAYFRLTYEGAKTVYTKPMSRKYFETLH